MLLASVDQCLVDLFVRSRVAVQLVVEVAVRDAQQSAAELFALVLLALVQVHLLDLHAQHEIHVLRVQDNRTKFFNTRGAELTSLYA